jgi:hypothetical protein
VVDGWYLVGRDGLVLVGPAQGDYALSTSFEVNDVKLLLDGARRIIDVFKTMTARM